MKKLIIPCIVALTLVAGGCGQNSEISETEEKVTPVETMKAEKGAISRELIYAGQVKALEQIYVVPKIPGKVIQINYDVGDKVEKDSILFEIDDTDIQSSIATAEAQYNASLAGVQTAKTSLDSISGAQLDTTALQYETAVKNSEIALENAELVIENAEIAYNNAQLALDNITGTYNSTKALYEAGAVPKAEFDRVELTYNQAVAGLEQAALAKEQASSSKAQAETANKQATEQYELFKNKTVGSTVNQAQSGVNQASSAAEVSKAALDNVVRTLDDLKVKSPMTGIVTARNISVGGMASQTSPAVTIINMDTVEVNTNVSEELINVIKVGDIVPVYISAVRETPFDGTIKTISPAAEEMKNTYPVKIEINNPNGDLKPGMFAEAHFVKEQSDTSVVLARNTVLSDESSKYVFIAEGDRAKKCIVETGIDNGKNIEILSGLPEGAIIIVKGHTSISDGDKIKVVGGE